MTFDFPAIVILISLSLKNFTNGELSLAYNEKSVIVGVKDNENKLFELQLSYNHYNEGPCKKYYRNSKLKSNIYFYCSKMYDKCEIYHCNGQPFIKTSYYDNVLHGYHRKYNTEGELIRERFYIDGVLQCNKIKKLKKNEFFLHKYKKCRL